MTINKYGNAIISLTKQDVEENKYEYGDVITLSFSKTSIEVPCCSNYSDVDSGSTAVFGRDDVKNTNLYNLAYNCIKSIGLNDGEINQLIDNLKAN